MAEIRITRNEKNVEGFFFFEFVVTTKNRRKFNVYSKVPFESMIENLDPHEMAYLNVRNEIKQRIHLYEALPSDDHFVACNDGIIYRPSVEIRVFYGNKESGNRDIGYGVTAINIHNPIESVGVTTSFNLFSNNASEDIRFKLFRKVSDNPAVFDVTYSSETFKHNGHGWQEFEMNTSQIASQGDYLGFYSGESNLVNTADVATGETGYYKLGDLDSGFGVEDWNTWHTTKFSINGIFNVVLD